MRWKARAGSLLRSLFLTGRQDRELEEELAFHLDRLAEEYQSAGLDPGEARRRARMDLGGLEQVKERVREDRKGAAMHSLLQDIRFAAHTFIRRERGLTAASIFTLALGIGAATAIFSLVESMLLKPLPYHQPERLVQLLSTWEGQHGIEPNISESVPYFRQFRDRMESFESLAGVYLYTTVGFDLDLDGQPQRVRSLPVTSGYFKTLGVRMQHGREFLPGEDENLSRGTYLPPAQPLTVLSHSLWQRLFGGDPDAVGQRVSLSGESYLVIGVAPAGLRDPLAGQVDLWVPQDIAPKGGNQWGNGFLTPIARLKEGSSIEQARAEMKALMAAIEEEEKTGQGRAGGEILPLQSYLVSGIHETLWILLAAVGVLMAIACVNVANLLMARGVSRRKEWALRSALGSSRGRLLRQVFTESLLLAITGGVAGFALARLLIQALPFLQPQGLPPSLEVSFDWTVFSFALSASALTGLLFALAPAAASLRLPLDGLLREEGRADSGSLFQYRLRGLLVSAQLALALLLLVSSGILAKSFVGLLRSDLGFSAEGVLTYRFDLPSSRYEDPQQRIGFQRELHRRLEGLPGVVAAGAVSKLPADGPFHPWGYRPLDDPASARSWYRAHVRCVEGRYFESLGIPRLAGRLFEGRDHAQAENVALISQELAQRHWPGGGAIGKRIYVPGFEGTIIGVVGDVHFDPFLPSAPMVYVSHQQFGANRNWSLWQTVRADPLRPELPGLIRREVQSMDPNLAVFQVRPMSEVAANGISRQRFAALLMGLFAAMSLILAGVGIYGVLSQAVGQRRREIGIRMALGAGARQVRWMVLRQSVLMAAAGLAVGMVASLAATRWLGSLVHEVDLRDPGLYALVALFLLLISLAVAYLPARRASRMHPVTAMRA